MSSSFDFVSAEQSPPHSFTRDRNNTFCFVCQNWWPESSAVLAKYYSCNACGLCAHAGCRYMALRCYPCEEGGDLRKEESLSLRTLTTNGIVFCSFLQAYDLKISSGTSIYAVGSFPGTKETITSDCVVVNDGDVVWSLSDDASCGSNAKQGAVEDSIEWISSKSTDISESSRAIIRVTLSSNTLYGMFDTTLLMSEISLVPLLLHPNVAVERWFSLRSPEAEGSSTGMILLRLAFVTEQSDISIQKPAVVDTFRMQSSCGTVSPEPCSSIKTEIRDPEDEKDSGGKEKLSKLIGNNEEHVAHRKETDETALTLKHSTSASISESNELTSVYDDTQVPGIQAQHKNNTSVGERLMPTLALEPEQNAGLDNQPAVPATLSRFRSTLFKSVKDISETVSTFVWDDYRFPRSKPKLLADSATGKVNCDVAIGKLTIELIDAYRTDVKDAADGDYFATCAVTDLTGPLYHNGVLLEEDTHTVCNSAAPVFNCIFEFQVPHFRCGVRLLLIDATTGKKIGTSVVSVYSLLQRDVERSLQYIRDSGSIFPFCMELDALSAGNTEGTGEPTELHRKLSKSSLSRHASEGMGVFPLRDMSDKNTIGHFTAKMTFRENVTDLFWSGSPKLANVGPSESLSVDRLRIHINRFKALVNLFHILCSEHRKIMDWEEPKTTLVLLVLFLYTTLWVNAEYAISVPLFIVVALMTKSWFFRYNGGFKKRIIESDGVAEPFSYRPFAYLRVAICDLKHFSASSVGGGYPYPQYAKISYVQRARVALLERKDLRSGNGSDVSELMIALVPVGQQLNNAEHSNFSTVSGTGISQLLSNLNIIKSDNLKGGILQNMSDPWTRNTGRSVVDISYVYPILQPDLFKESAPDVMRKTVQDDGLRDDQRSDQHCSNIQGSTMKLKFQPWKDLDSSVKFTFFGDSPEQSFVDSTLGTISIPFRDLIRSGDCSGASGLQQEISGWFPVKWNSSFSNQALQSGSVHENDDWDSSNAKPDVDDHLEPLVFLRLQLDLRDCRKPPSDHENEVSRAVQALLSNDEDTSNGAISTLWNMPENVRYIQNLMGSILNTIESCKNIFNWTIPSKTNLVYCALVFLWLVSVLVPGRYLLLAGGLYDFFYCFFPQPDEYPFDTRLQNLLEALPNDDDLEQVYDGERKQFNKVEAEKHKSNLKKTKLRLIFECLWDGSVRLKDNRFLLPAGGGGGWVGAFVVLHEHKLVWWNNEDEVSDGKAHIGQLLLYGHAGVSHASPMDIKEFGDDGRLLSIFGKDITGTQRKITLLCKDSSSCQALAAAVNSVLIDKES